MLSYKLLEEIQEYIKANLKEVPENATNEEVIGLWNEQSEDKITYQFPEEAPKDKNILAQEMEISETKYNPDNDFPIPSFLKGDLPFEDIILTEEEEPKKKRIIKERKSPKLRRMVLPIEEIELDEEFDGSLIHEAPVLGAKPFPGLDEKLKTIDESFTQMLFRKIDEQGITDADCYHKAQLNRSHFNKIKNDPSYHIQKETVIALALALKLDRKETDEMLIKAGFALSPSSKADLIIEYCLAHNIYDVTEVNQILYSFDQKLLGAGIRE